MTAKIAVTSGICPFSHRVLAEALARFSTLTSNESKLRSRAFGARARFRLLYPTSWRPLPYRVTRNFAAKLPLAPLSPELDRKLGIWVDPGTDFSGGLLLTRIQRFDDPVSSFIRIHEGKELDLHVKREHAPFIGKVSG